MANNPPPYSNITGISRAAMKDNAQESLANYDGNARPGELVVNLETDPPLVYVGNNNGVLTLVGTEGPATTWATLGDKNNASGPTKIALGQNSATTQGNQSVAIGQNAGQTQGSTAVAIGQNAGGAVALQGDDAVAIGHAAGENTQGTQSVAIGLYAGQVAQGIQTVAIGAYAGQTNQANNSIILNATSSPLNQTTANTFTVKPVRGDSVGNLIGGGFLAVYYNPTTGEFAYASS